MRTVTNLKLHSNHGPVVMEVNSSLGLEGVETSTGEEATLLTVPLYNTNHGFRR